MLPRVLLVANMPTIVCTICSAFLAYKERPQWVWFAGWRFSPASAGC